MNAKQLIAIAFASLFSFSVLAEEPATEAPAEEVVAEEAATEEAAAE